MNKSATSLNHKITPESVFHLVHNNNNINDNTLKKRNALVTFEFKTLLDKAANPTTFSDLEEEKLNDELSNITKSSLPKDNRNHETNIRNLVNSPTWSSSSSPSNNSSSTSSILSAQPKNDLIESFPTFSPSQVFHFPHRPVSPITEEQTEIETQINTKPKSKVLLEKNESFDYSNKYQEHSESYEINQFLKQKNQNISPYSNQNITIWREELNNKNNIQEQIKKQVRIIVQNYTFL